MAYEKVTLYGVPIVAPRKVNYGRIDPALSRELFIRHALVEGDWQTHHEFFADNRRLLERSRSSSTGPAAATSSSTTRRSSSSTTSGSRPTWSPARHFDSWWKKARRDAAGAADLRPRMLDQRAAPTASREDDYPDAWRQDGLQLPLTYQFEPGADADGVTVHIPLPLLNQVPDAELRLAGAGPARGAGHRADPVAAEGAAAQLRPGARTTRPGGARRMPATATGRCSTRWSGSCAG